MTTVRRRAGLDGANGPSEATSTAPSETPSRPTESDAGPTELEAGPSFLVLAPVVLVLTGLGYFQSLWGDFCLDDPKAIMENPAVLGTVSILDSFRLDYWGEEVHLPSSHKSWRPLTTLTFRLNHALHGLDTFGYHLGNVLIQAVVCLVFHRVARRLCHGPLAAALATVLFTVHPIHVEAVSSAVGRAELLCALFFLLGFMSYDAAAGREGTRAGYFCLFCINTVLSILCKENGIMIMPVVTVLDICVNTDIIATLRRGAGVGCRSGCSGDGDGGARGLTSGDEGTDAKHSPVLPGAVVRRLAALVLYTGAVSFARLRVNGPEPHKPSWQPMDNAAAQEDGLTQLLTYTFLAAYNFFLLVFPRLLAADCNFLGCILVTSPTDWRVGAAAVFFAGMIAVAAAAALWARDPAVWVVPLAWMVATYLLASNLLFHVGFTLAERVLYLPSGGYCILAASALVVARRRWFRGAGRRQVWWSVVGVVIALLLARTVSRDAEWRSGVDLFRANVRDIPHNYKAWYILGNELYFRDRCEEAVDAYYTGTRIRPDFFPPYSNLGTCLIRLGRMEEAVEAFRVPMVNEYNPPWFGEFYVNYGNLLERLERHDEALEQFQRANLYYDIYEAHYNRGNLLQRLDRPYEALPSFVKAVELRPTDPAALTGLGVSSARTGKWAEARGAFSRALSAAPGDSTIQSWIAIVDNAISTGTKQPLHVRYRDQGDATGGVKGSIDIGGDDPAAGKGAVGEREGAAQSGNSLDYAVQLEKEGRVTQAEDLLRLLWKQGDARAAINLAVLYNRQRKFSESVELLTTVEGAAIGNNVIPEVHANLAVSYLGMEMFKEAVARLELRIQHTDPSQTEAIRQSYVHLAIAHFKTGKFKKSRKVLRMLEREYGEDSIVSMMLDKIDNGDPTLNVTF